MPRLDNTGPSGNGPMTGRGLGRCNSQNKISQWFGFGTGKGRKNMGGGQGSGRGAGGNRYTDKDYSENNYRNNDSAIAEVLNELKSLNNRISKLENTK